MPVRKILLVLGGEPPPIDLLTWYHEEAGLSIAVDSGWLAFLHAGIMPDVLIGDLDSCGDYSSNLNAGSQLQVVLNEDQEKTDFQKALSFILDKNIPQEIVLLGALGKRTDHLLNNLSILSGIPEEIDVVLDSENEWIKRVTKNKPAVVKGRAGGTISLISQSPQSLVSTSGLKWNLTDYMLSWGGKISQSNEFSSDISEISVKSGTLLIFIQK